MGALNVKCRQTHRPARPGTALRHPCPWRADEEGRQYPNRFGERVADLRDLRDLRKPDVGEQVWSRFSNPKAKSLCYYRALANVFQEYLPGQLANELEEIVTVLERP